MTQNDLQVKKNRAVLVGLWAHRLSVEENATEETVEELADLLETHGFRVDIKNDSMFAVAEAYNAEEPLRRTRLIGYLLIHSRQVDMIMKDTVRAAALKEKLAGDMATLMAKPLQFS